MHTDNTLASWHFAPRPGTSFYGGLALTLVIALGGYILSSLPGFRQVGPLASSILLAMAYRQVFGYPEALQSGIHFSSKRLLRLAIVLYGLKLSIGTILHEGLGLLLFGALTIAFFLVLTPMISKKLGGNASLSILLGVGGGVCGAAAIAAVSPILRSEDEDTAMSVGIVALLGTIFSIAYTVVRPLLPLTGLQYGIWSGISLHEIAHVALATAPAGPGVLAIGLLAKLCRVFLLIPLSLALMYWTRRQRDETRGPIEAPWFLAFFVLMSIFGSYVMGKYVYVSASVVAHISSTTTFLLAMAMTGLGFNVNLRDLRTKALWPLLAVTLTSCLWSVLSLIIVYYME